MRTDDVTNHFGGVSATAKALGVTRPAVYHWRKKGFVPERVAWKLQFLTGGKLRVDPALYARRPAA